MEKVFAEIEKRVRAFMKDSSQGEFSQLALDLFRIQRIHNPAYAKLSGKSGEVKRWEDIPAVPTVAFKELEMTSLPESERKHVFYSSGTTLGNRSRHFHSAASISLYDESLSHWFNNNFSGGKRFFLTPKSADSSSLAHMFNTLAAENKSSQFFGRIDADGAWQIDVEPLLKALRETKGPIGLMGTAFLFVNLLEALDSNIQLPKGSWILETGGYKGRSREIPRNEFHRMLSEKLGVPGASIFGEYGMSELSSQAYDRADGVFRFPHWARARIISPATGREVADGERGLIRVYDLANVWSVIAVQTEDIGIRRGDAFELAGRASQAEARGCSLMTV